MKIAFILLMVVCLCPIGHGNASDLKKHIEKAYSYADSGNKTAAIQEFEKARTIAPHLPDIWYSLGVLYDCPVSIRYYKEAIKLDPKYEDAHYNLGACYEKDGKIKEARAQYKNVLNINPQNPKLHYWIGQSYLRERDYKSSIPFLQNSLKLQPTHYYSALDLGNAFENVNAPSEAIKYYLKALLSQR